MTLYTIAACPIMTVAEAEGLPEVPMLSATRRFIVMTTSSVNALHKVAAWLKGAHQDRMKGMEVLELQAGPSDNDPDAEVVLIK